MVLSYVVSGFAVGLLVGLTGVNWTKDPLVPDSEPPAELDYNLWLGPAPWRPYNKQRVRK